MAIWYLEKWWKKAVYVMGWIAIGYLAFSFLIGFIIGFIKAINIPA